MDRGLRRHHSLDASSVDQLLAGVARLPGDVERSSDQILSVAVEKGVRLGMYGDTPTTTRVIVIPRGAARSTSRARPATWLACWRSVVTCCSDTSVLDDDGSNLAPLTVGSGSDGFGDAQEILIPVWSTHPGLLSPNRLVQVSPFAISAAPLLTGCSRSPTQR